MDCLPFTDVPCTGGDASRCRGNFVLSDCHELIHCDENIPPVELVETPKLHHADSWVDVWWHGVRWSDHIEIIVTMIENKLGPVYDFNYRGFSPDTEKPDTERMKVGMHLDESFKYMIAVRRVRGNRGSVWTTAYVGEALHNRAFSKGFAVGFE